MSAGAVIYGQFECGPGWCVEFTRGDTELRLVPGGGMIYFIVNPDGRRLFANEAFKGGVPSGYRYRGLGDWTPA